MSEHAGPRVSVGLPVYNGEEFVGEAIRSILDQSFDGFELIISDNASTDRTDEIVRALAARDPRVRYSRNAENLGAGPNYRRVFGLARGAYFKWAAHDDALTPDFLARCVEVLDRDPGVVVCFTEAAVVDAAGEVHGTWRAPGDLASPDPRSRLRACQLLAETIPIWGLMRADVLRRTPLLGDYPGHDRPLLAELALRGRFHQVPEALFRHRDHARRSVRMHDARDPHAAAVWYDTRRPGRLMFPQWRLLAEFLAAIRRAPLRPVDRLRCCVEIGDWALRYRTDLTRDLFVAAERVPAVGPFLGTAYRRLRRVGRAAAAIGPVVPAGSALILVDDDALPPEPFARWRTLPFLEKGGRYWGRPLDDDQAVAELERMRGAGAAFVAFAWPAFWWLEHYAGLHRHLRARYRCALRNRHLVVFDLRA